MIEVDVDILVSLFKARLERDMLWIKRSQYTNLISPLWDIIADYCVDDPVMVDRIIEAARAWNYYACKLGNISFEIEIKRWSSGMELCVYENQKVWRIYDVDIFAILLDMPQFKPRRDIIQHDHLVAIRRYLYGDIRADNENQAYMRNPYSD